jgi:hypothetical protein
MTLGILNPARFKFWFCAFLFPINRCSLTRCWLAAAVIFAQTALIWRAKAKKRIAARAFAIGFFSAMEIIAT